MLAGPIDGGALSDRLLWGTEIPRQRICSSECVGQGQVWAWPVLEESKDRDKRKEEELLGNQLSYDATDSTPSGDPSGLR